MSRPSLHGRRGITSTALAPDADETSQSLLDKFATTPVFGHIEVTDGRVWLKQSGVAHFAGRPARGGAEANLRDARGARARPLQPKGRGHGVEVQAELVCPLQGGPDGSPGSQRSVSKRMKATTTEVTASHAPMLSKPDVVLDVIRKTASAVSAS